MKEAILMLRRRVFASLVFIFFFTAMCFAQSQGEKLFKENNPSDAVQVLENEISKGIVSDNSYNFLGLAYYQLGEFEKSIKAFQKGIDVQPENLKILSFNQGNSYFALKNYKAAVECYSRSLSAAPSFYEALLNRANSLLMNNQLAAARSDYVSFIENNPDNPQRPRIEELIKAIDEELRRREEEERLAREREKALWEQIDPSPEEAYYGPDGAEWERFDDEFEEKEYQKREKNWEKFEADSIKKIADEKKDPEWESLDKKEMEAISEELAEALEEENAGSLNDDKDSWESIDEKEKEVLRKLDAQGVEEYKKRKEELLQDVLEDSEASRKKRLDDLVNSLQNTDATNVSSGTDGLIEYEMEGELD